MRESYRGLERVTKSCRSSVQRNISLYSLVRGIDCENQISVMHQPAAAWRRDTMLCAFALVRISKNSAEQCTASRLPVSSSSAASCTPCSYESCHVCISPMSHATQTLLVYPPHMSLIDPSRIPTLYESCHACVAYESCHACMSHMSHVT